MTPQQHQAALIHSAATTLEIDPTNVLDIGGQSFFLFTRREAGRIIGLAFSRWGWAPAMIAYDARLPRPGKGMEYIATDFPYNR